MTYSIMSFIENHPQLKFIPFRPGTKKPLETGWDKKCYTYEEAKQKGQDQVGVVTGGASDGLIDIDLDHPEAWKAAKTYLPKTECVFGRSSKPYGHFLYWVSEQGPTQKFYIPNASKPVLEIRSNGSPTMFPGSTHPEGEPVTFTESGEPGQTTFDTLLDAASKITAVRLMSLHWDNGKRHDCALAVSGVLARNDWSKQDVKKFVKCVAETAGDSEIADRLAAVESTFASKDDGRSYWGLPKLRELLDRRVVDRLCELLSLYTDSKDTKPAEVNVLGVEIKDASDLSDIKLAPEFAKYAGAKLGFQVPSNIWIAWDGRKWGADKALAHEALAQKFIGSVVDTLTVKNVTNDHPLRYAVKRSLDTQGWRGLINTAKSRLTCDLSGFDTELFKLNLQNGVLDLQTGTLSPHNPDLKMSMIANVAYDQEASCPTFDAFMQTTFGKENQVVIDFVIRALGYSLSGSTAEHKFFLCNGSGRNGKSTLMNTVAYMLGDYAKTVPTKALMTKKGDSQASPEIARLMGNRLLQASELAREQKLDEPFVKAVTSGDPIVTRALFKDPFELVPRFKLWLATNHLPDLTADDEAIWARTVLIPFNNVVQKPDIELPEKLKLEASGILNRLLDGFREWRNNGLQVPDVIKAATKDYRAKGDSMSAFVESGIEKLDDGGSLFKDIYAAYQALCSDEGFGKPESAKVFGQFLQNKGFKKSPGKAKGVRYLGLKPKEYLQRSPDWLQGKAAAEEASAGSNDI